MEARFLVLRLTACAACLLAVSPANLAQQSAPPVAPAPSSQPASPEFVNARKLIEQGKVDDAIAELHTVESRDPAAKGLALEMGTAYYKKSDFPKAIEYLKRATLADPASGEATQLLGLSYYLNGHPSDAIPMLEKVQGWYSRANVDAAYILGICYIQTKDYPQARMAFAKMFAVPPDSAASYLFTARILLRQDYDPVAELVSYYRPLRAISQSIDVVPPTDPLTPYKLVVAPGLNVLSDAAARNLIEYVRQGGHLVLGQRSGMKDQDNGLQPERQPGPLADLLGGRVEQYYALIDPVPVTGKFGSSQGKLWAELLSANNKETEVLATYGESNGWLDGMPAAITRKTGKGRITYMGAWLDEAGMASAAKWMTDISGVKPALGTVPDGVEVYPRYGSKGTVYILVNFSKTQQSVSLPSPMSDVLEGGSKASVTLPRYGVAVLSAAH